MFNIHLNQLCFIWLPPVRCTLRRKRALPVFAVSSLTRLTQIQQVQRGGQYWTNKAKKIYIILAWENPNNFRKIWICTES